MNNFIKEKVKKWSEDYWKRMEDDKWLNENGNLEIVNRYGGVDYELSKEKFFGNLEKVNNFDELESWFVDIMGEDCEEGFGVWLDIVLKE